MPEKGKSPGTKSPRLPGSKGILPDRRGMIRSGRGAAHGDCRCAAQGMYTRVMAVTLPPAMWAVPFMAVQEKSTVSCMVSRSPAR